MRKNTSGTTDSKNYYIGRGKLYFALHDANGRPKAWEDLGNCPDFSISVDPEVYEHQSSREGLRKTDLEIVIEQNLEASFTLDEAHLSNISRFLSGDEATMTVGTKVGEASMVDVLGAGVGDIVAGRWYDLVKLVGTTETRYYGIADAADLTLQFLDGASPVALTEGTDYEVEAQFGRIFLKPESALVIAAAADTDQKLQFTLDANAAAPDSVHTVEALTTTEVRGAVKFISENANSAASGSGSKSEITLWNVNLTPNGDFGLISDEAAQMQFNAAATPSNASGKTLSIVSPDYAS